MPYYLYKISVSDGIGLVKNLELVDQFQVFKDAKLMARVLRTKSASESVPESTSIFKVIFADSQLFAEEQLLENREKPILMEHEI